MNQSNIKCYGALLAATIAFLPAPAVYAAGIPVFDGAAVAQSAQQQIETITKWVEQHEAMLSQIEQLKNTYQSLNGSRGLGNIMNNPALRDYLPPDWQNVYDNVKRGGYGGLTGTAKSLYSSNKIFDNCASITDNDQRGVCQAQSVKGYQDKGLALDAFAAAKSRIDQIDQLMNQINLTQDPKAVAELQARIAAEQANIQNEQTKLQLYSMVSAAEDKIQKQQRAEINAKARARRGWIDPTID